MGLLIIYLAPANAQENLCDMFNAYENKNKFQMPFVGKWKVVWGGCKKKNNFHHATNKSQRFAYDFIKINKKGKFYKTKGKVCSDYYSYNQPILAPASGVVINIIDGIKDTPIGGSNLYFVPGNLIVIKHKKNEYSFIAHIKKGSFKVKEGDRVKKGQVLAKVGNSGNSTMPHIHYQLGDSPNFGDSKGLPISFYQIKVKQKIKDMYKPVKNDIVQNAF